MHMELPTPDDETPELIIPANQEPKPPKQPIRTAPKAIAPPATTAKAPVAAKPKPVTATSPAGTGPSPSPSPATPGSSSLPAASPEAAPKADVVEFDGINEDAPKTEHPLPEVVDFTAFWKAAKVACPNGKEAAVDEALTMPLSQYLKSGGTLDGALKALKAFKGVVA